MKRRLIFLIVTLVVTNLSAQIDTSEYKYQLAIKVFETKYEKKQHGKFKGKIEVIDSNTFSFKAKFHKVNTVKIREFEYYGKIKEELKGIFTEGILYPKLILYKDIQFCKRHKTDRCFNVSLYFIAEMEKLNPDSQTKRFFLLKRFHSHPQCCYFELYNAEATENTTMEEFIKGAILTFFYTAPTK